MSANTQGLSLAAVSRTAFPTAAPFTASVQTAGKEVLSRQPIYMMPEDIRQRSESTVVIICRIAVGLVLSIWQPSAASAALGSNSSVSLTKP